MLNFTSIRLLLIAFIYFFPLSIFSQPPTITYVAEISGLPGAPVEVVNAGDGSNRLFVVQQNGFIYVRNGPTGTALKEFANIGPTGANLISVSGERGLLSMAFHPNYNGTTNRYFFVYYTDLSGNIALTRFQTLDGNSDTTDLTTATNFLTVPHPTNSNHNGGKLNFGPDGYLYFALGDGGGGNDVPNNAQTGTVLLGKMLRIDVDNTSVAYGYYSVPTSNPYIQDPNIDDRIWALGLRNPFRWSFDRLTGDMWIGDVGQDTWEEIDFRAAGITGHVNYGWRCFEGYVSTPNVADCTPVDYVPPVKTYPNPASGASSVIGGYVYRGTEFPNYRGYYIATDVYSGDIYKLWPNGSGGFDSSVQTGNPVTAVVGFGEGEDGSIYAVSQATNTVYKIIPIGGTPLALSLVSFSAITRQGYNELKWLTNSEAGIINYQVEYSRDGVNFTNAGNVSPNINLNGNNYIFEHHITNTEDIFYRIAIQKNNNTTVYSPVLRLGGTNKGVRIYPNIISNSVLTFDPNGKAVQDLKIVNTTGHVIFQRDMRNVVNLTRINLPAMQNGIYLVQVTGDGFTQTEKIIIE